MVGVVGWGLVITLLGEWPVTPEHDWRFSFFVSLWLGICGAVLPLIWFLHRRFASPEAGETWHSFGMLSRQAAWVGSWATLCAWLQMHRTLNWAMALLLLAVFVLLELLMQTRQEIEE
ncbi:MAG: hypothetical protein JXA42_15775 [Anaerolineales bacterium]|nr:hypothetical protein [Anaerolineales bacterium]